MWSYVIRRVLATLPVMGVVAVIVFLMLRLSPGDPAAIIAGSRTSEDIAQIRENLGLDRRWSSSSCAGSVTRHRDFGSRSISKGRARLIMDGWNPTSPCPSPHGLRHRAGGPLGVIAAWRRGPGGSDHHGPVGLAFSVPVFLVGTAW